MYLAAVMDVYSRAIMGWGMNHSLGGKLAADALEMAVHQRGVPNIVHSDRGSAYQSRDVKLAKVGPGARYGANAQEPRRRIPT